MAFRPRVLRSLAVSAAVFALFLLPAAVAPALAVAPPPLSVNITAPASGAVAGFVTISVSTNPGVTGITIKRTAAGGGAVVQDPVSVSNATPSTDWSVIWDVTNIANGSIYDLTASAIDPTTGMLVTSPAVSITVNNPVPLTVTLVSPSTGSASGTVTIVAKTNFPVGSLDILREPAGGGAVTQTPINLTSAASPKTDWTATWDISKLANGSIYKLTASAIDPVNQKTVLSTPATITINNPTPLTVEITAPGNGSTLTGSVTITAKTSLPVSALDIAFSTTAGPTPPTANLTNASPKTDWSYTWDTTKYANGTYAIKAVATDPNTGKSVGSALVQTTVNNAAGLAVVMVTPVNGSTISGSYTVTAKTSLPVSALDIVFTSTAGPPPPTANLANASPKTDWTYAWDTTVYANGTYAISASAVDPGTGKTVTSAAVQITVSNESKAALTVIIVNPPAGNVSGAVAIKVKTSLPVGALDIVLEPGGGGAVTQTPINLTSAASPKTDWTATWDVSGLVNGSIYKLTASAVDPGTGKTVTGAAVQVTVNNAAAMTVQLTSPGNGSTISGSITITAKTSLPVGALDIVFTTTAGSPPPTANLTSSASKTDWSYTWDTTKSANGAYVITASAVDPGTGKTLMSSPATVNVDNEAAEALNVSLTQPAAGSVSGAIQLAATTNLPVVIVDFVFEAVGAFAQPPLIRVKSDQPKTDWTATWDTTKFANGTYKIQAVALSATQVSATSPAVSVDVSNELPKIDVTLSAPASGSTISGAAALSASTSQPVAALDFVFELVTSVTGAAQPSPIHLAPSSPQSSWTATWDTTKAANASYRVKAVALGAAGTLGTSTVSTVTVSNEMSTPLTVVVTMPSGGSVLSKVASLSATVSRKTESLEFLIAGGQIDPAKPAVVKASSSVGDGILWSAVWDTFSVGNGSYSLKARAVATDSTTVSGPVDIKVDNQGAPPPSVAVKVSLITPAPGVTLAGQSTVVAQTDQKVGAVTFQITDPMGKSVAVEGVSGDGLKWTAVLDTLKFPNGKYQAVAKATANLQPAGASGSNAFAIQNAAPVPGEQPPAPLPGEPVAPPPLAVKIAPLPSPVRGSVLLRAGVSGGPSAVSFLIKPAEGAGGFARDAVFAPETGSWSALWLTTDGPDGQYQVSASAKTADGRSAASPTLTVAVLNAGAGAPVLLPDVQIIPPEVVRDAVKAIPVGTTPLPTQQLPTIAVQPLTAAADECTAAQVPPDKCSAWLAWNSRTDECQVAGIVTKEECVSFLRLKLGAQLPVCTTGNEPGCADIAKRTAGLISVAELDRIEGAVVPLIGTVIKFQRPARPAAEAAAAPEQPASPAEVPAAAQEKLAPAVPPPTADVLLAEVVPLKADQPVSLKVQASPAYVAAGEMSQKAMPAVLMIDSDGDGLPDDVEKRLGTDPTKADTDGDGYTDAVEIKNGYNPLGPGKLGEAEAQLAPVDVAIVSGAPIEQPKATGETSADLAVDKVEKSEQAGAGQPPGLKFSGKGKPGQIVSIFVYSYLPLVMTTTADADGNWSYDLGSNLEDGEHTVYVAVTDDTGKIKSKSGPLSFFVAEAQAATAQEFFGTPAVQAAVGAAEPVDSMMRWYIVGAIVLVVIALAIAAMIIFRPKRTGGGFE